LIYIHQHVTPRTVSVNRKKNTLLCLFLGERVDPEQQGGGRMKQEFAKQYAYLQGCSGVRSFQTISSGDITFFFNILLAYLQSTLTATE
jgi:hypothetical protein